MPKTIRADQIQEKLVLKYLQMFYSPDALEDIQNLVEYWSKNNESIFLDLNNEKRKLFSRQFRSEELIKFVKKQKKENPSFFEIVCLAIVLQFQKDNYILDTPLPQRKHIIKSQSLTGKIKRFFTEIQMQRYQQKASWREIAKALKQNHQYAFRGYKVDASHLRKVFMKLEKEAGA